MELDTPNLSLILLLVLRLELYVSSSVIESMELDYSGNVTGRAVIPHLNIAVKQDGRIVDSALDVAPGTPLELVVYLDRQSAPIYGLMATSMKATDNTPRNQEQVLVMNGCSIDRNLFGNFETSDGGDSVSAKFRAFKFPDSNYVRFVGTVNVCLQKCQGVECKSGLIGYGRRRRSIAQDPNKILEVQMVAFLRVGFKDNLHSTPKDSLTGVYHGKDGEKEIDYIELANSQTSKARNPVTYFKKEQLISARRPWSRNLQRESILSANQTSNKLTAQTLSAGHGSLDFNYQISASFTRQGPGLVWILLTALGMIMVA